MAAPGHSLVPFAFPDQFYNSYLTILTFQCGIELHFQSSSQEKLMIQKWYYFKLMVGQPIPSTHGVKGFSPQPCGETNLEGCSTRSSSASLRIIECRWQPQFPLLSLHFPLQKRWKLPSSPGQDISLWIKCSRRGEHSKGSAGNRLWPLRGWKWLTDKPGLNLWRQIFGLWPLNNTKSLRKKKKINSRLKLLRTSLDHFRSKGPVSEQFF